MKNAITGRVVSQTGTLTGTISGSQTLTGQISQEISIVGNLATAYSFGSVKYDGDYEITPTVNGLTMETKDRYMTENVKIHAIPFFEVGNTSGGNTVYIAGEIEME